jgi:hypothetical protein
MYFSFKVQYSTVQYNLQACLDRHFWPTNPGQYLTKTSNFLSVAPFKDFL